MNDLVSVTMSKTNGVANSYLCVCEVFHNMAPAGDLSAGTENFKAPGPT